MTPEYLAGLFDGEGCIDVQRMYPKLGSHTSRFYVRPRVRLAMTDACWVLGQALHERFGGHLTRRKPTTPTQNPSWSLEWLSRKDILAILDVIEPYLILKAQQAKLARWWFENASGKQTKSGYVGMEQARKAFAEELSAMKRDPQRLSERAAERIVRLMRQSDLHGDMQTPAETIGALAG